MSLSSGMKLGHYEIRSKLGAGGMGEVYLAEDTQLGRKVAIKVLLSESTTDEQARKRLIREARAAAKLDHPNICTIHEVGEEDGRSFIVMQYIEGETLAARIARKPLELSEALDQAIQMAHALAEAHSRDLIHRDIKPQNIMLTVPGEAKVMDFGLAKVIRDRSLTESEAVTETLLTDPGGVVGTIPYMSPEQVQGEVIDARSDVFSFGAVLYEMVSSHKPFEADNSAALISAILSREPLPLTRYAVDVTPELDRIVRRCLEKNRERRYQTMRDVAIDLENLQREPALREDSQTAGLRVTGHDVKRTSVFTSRRALVFYSLAAVLVVAAIAYLVFLRGSPAITQPEIKSLAVIPLDNFSGDPAQDYLADGMTEALITELSKIGALRVISRASVMQYKAARKPLPEIGRELNVDVIVTGSVQRSGDKIGITAHLHRAATDQNLWANQYERELREVLSLQREVARAIASEINVKLTPQEQGLLVNARPVNPEAYEAHLWGLYYFNHFMAEQREEPLKKSIEFYEQAIKLDGNFALVYAHLSGAYFLYGRNFGYPEFRAKSRDAAIRSVQLDDTLAEAHTALAGVFITHDWNWSGAEQEFKRAIQLNPNLAGAHARYSHLLLYTGRFVEALAENKKAEQLDPFSLWIKENRAQIHSCARNYDLAIEQNRKLIELSPKSHWVYAGRVASLVNKGMYKEAFVENQKRQELSGGDRRYKVQLAWANAMSGNGTEAFKILNELQEQPKARPVRNLIYARIYAALGDKQRALERLEKAYQERDSEVPLIRCDREFDSLRSEPRFQDLLQRIGLPQ